MHSPVRSHPALPTVHTRATTRGGTAARRGAGRWLATAVAMTSAIALGGCFITVDDDDDYHDDDDGYVAPPPSPTVEEVYIDEGERLEADPGRGVGVFVEYLGAGTWHVWTTCDTENNGVACAFDLDVAGYGLSSVDPEDLEDYDSIDVGVDRATLYFDTSIDTDGVFIQLSDLQPLTLGSYLDDGSAATFVSWVEDAQVWQGAPTNPVVFVP